MYINQIITVYNQWCKPVDFDAAVQLMDDEIREHIVWTERFEGNPQGFFDTYCICHYIKYGEDFEPNKISGQW